MPGFNDVHTHILSGGLDMDNVNLQGAGDLSEIQTADSHLRPGTCRRRWVQGRGWGYGAFPGRHTDARSSWTPPFPIGRP